MALKIEISQDNMIATAVVEPPVDDEEATGASDVLAALESSGIVFGIVDEDKIRMFAEEGMFKRIEFIAARGKQPGNAEDGRIELCWKKADAAPKTSDGSMNLREITTVPTIARGEVAARKYAPVKGSSGMTVMGVEIPGEWGSDVTLKAGVNVKCSEDGKEFIAEISGSPRMDGNAICVDPVHIVAGSVDYSTGNIEFDGAVEIRGGVMDGFVVKAGGSVTIDGNVQAASIFAGGDLNVTGGIITRNSGTITSGGCVKALYIENSSVAAQGDIVVERAIINSFVYSNANVVCMSNEGKIMAGETMAFGEIRAKYLGTDRETPTMLRVGFKFDVFKQLVAHESELSRLNDISIELEKNIKSAGSVGKTDVVKQCLARLAEVKNEWRATHSKYIGLKSKTQIYPLASVKGEESIFPGCMIYVGTTREKVERKLRYATLASDGDGAISLFSFDENSGRMITCGVGQAEVKKTVLIVDDAKFMRRKLRNILENCSFKVVGEAEDGMQAIKMYSELKPDVVTMDITMPIVDGITSMKAIMKINPQSKVVMISALGQQEKVKSSILAGAKDFIMKPFVPERVAEVISRIVYT